MQKPLIIICLLLASEWLFGEDIPGCKCDTIRPFNIYGKTIIDLVLENYTQFKPKYLANEQNYKEVKRICEIKNAKDSLSKRKEILFGIVLESEYGLIDDNFRFAIIVSELDDDKLRKQAIDIIYKGGRIDFIKAYSKEIYLRLINSKQPDAIRLLMLCNLNADEIKEIMKRNQYVYPEVKARMGDTAVENELINRFEHTCKESEIKTLPKSLSYVGSKKCVLSLIKSLADSSFIGGEFTTVANRYYILQALGNICPCEKILNEEFDRYAHGVGVKITFENQYTFKDSIRLYYSRVYDWVNKNYHLKIEGLKSANLLWSEGGSEENSKCFKENKMGDTIKADSSKKTNKNDLKK